MTDYVSTKVMDKVDKGKSSFVDINEREGQLHVNEKNIAQFERYRNASDQLKTAIRDAYKRQIDQATL